ncbi:MAG: hypothetical protein M3Q10_18595 [Chloroflexota bacterium]|nr:hypothetical protein [Chloroflexota bacterium]
MDNSPRLPTVSILLAIGLGLITGASFLSREVGDVPFLSEAEIGMVAIGFTLAIFGVQGLISVLLEGRQLHPGIVRPRLTDPLSIAIIVSSVVLFGIAVALAYGIVLDWSPIALGLVAGAGCLILAMLLVFYKEAFVGDEACFDDREDGVPW